MSSRAPIAYPPDAPIPGRRALLNLALSLAALLVIALGMFLMISPGSVQPVVAAAGMLFGLAVFSLMIVRHEWLLIIGIVAGHSIFYGKFPSQLGMRLKDSAGPGDLLFFLAFVAAIVYWFAEKVRPGAPRAILTSSILLFIYTSCYVLIAFFLWDRQDNALTQVIGWLYFTVAIPTYLCLATGRAWRPYFFVLFLTLLGGAILAFMVQAGYGQSIIERTGYGGLGARSFGDMTVRTNQLGMAVSGTLIAIVVAAFAKSAFWKYAAVIGGLAGAMIIFLDRGRATYAGMLAAVVLLLLMMPNTARVRFSLRSLTAILTGILIVLAIGGPVREKLVESYEKAITAVELTSRQAIDADRGVLLRMQRLARAEKYISDNPLFGGGPGVFFGTDVNYLTNETQFITFIDNSWIYPTAVGGLVGMALILFCYIAFTGAAIWCFLRLKHPFHRALATVPLAHLAWLLVCSPVNWWMIDRYHVAAFSFSVGMVCALVYHERVNGSEKPILEVYD